MLQEEGSFGFVSFFAEFIARISVDSKDQLCKDQVVISKISFLTYFKKKCR